MTKVDFQVLCLQVGGGRKISEVQVRVCYNWKIIVLLSFFSLIKRIYPRVSTKSLPTDAESPLPVDVRRSKTLLLKLPNNLIRR